MRWSGSFPPRSGSTAAARASTRRAASSLADHRPRSSLDVESFERFLHKAYLGQKRFSIEGAGNPTTGDVTMVGDKAFFTILRRWVAQNAHGTVSTEKFVRLAERVSGKQLDRLFHEERLSDVVVQVRELRHRRAP